VSESVAAPTSRKLVLIALIRISLVVEPVVGRRRNRGDARHWHRHSDRAVLRAHLERPTSRRCRSRCVSESSPPAGQQRHRGAPSGSAAVTWALSIFPILTFLLRCSGCEFLSLQGDGAVPASQNIYRAGMNLHAAFTSRGADCSAYWKHSNRRQRCHCSLLRNRLFSGRRTRHASSR
jgi:hypothetical protein